MTKKTKTKQNKKKLSYRLFVFPNADGQKQQMKRFVISMQGIHRVL